MTKFPSREDPGYDAILGELQRWTKMIRGVKEEVAQEMDTVPYLDSKALEAYILNDSDYRSNPSPVLSTGPTLLGKYRETWKNLLDALGLELLFNTNHVKRIPMDLRFLPENVTNPFAFNMEAVAWLAAFLGCNSIAWEGNVPQFLGPSMVLHLTCEKPFLYLGHFERLQLYPAYYSVSPNVLTASLMAAARGVLLYQREILSLEPEFAREIMNIKTSSRILEDLEAVSCTCSTSYSMPPLSPQRSELGLSALPLLAANSPWAVRAFPMESCRIEKTLQQLSELHHPHFVWQKNYTVGMNNLINHLLNENSIEFQTISAKTMYGVAFCGDSFDSRALGLFTADPDGYEIHLGWSWLGYEAQWGPSPERPRWPARLGIHARNLVLITGIPADAGRESITSNNTDAPWAFRKSLIQCQLQEVDWWLLQHAKAMAACQTRLLLSALESSGEDEVRRMTIDFPEVDDDGFGHSVREVLVLRAMLVGCLLASAMDLSSLHERHMTEELVLLR